jgi:hypothetical protein
MEQRQERHAGPRARVEVRDAGEHVALFGQDERRHQEANRDIRPEQHPHRRKPLQRLLSIRVAPDRRGEHDRISGEVSAGEQSNTPAIATAKLAARSRVIRSCKKRTAKRVVATGSEHQERERHGAPHVN